MFNKLAAVFLPHSCLFKQFSNIVFQSKIMTTGSVDLV